MSLTQANLKICSRLSCCIPVRSKIFSLALTTLPVTWLKLLWYPSLEILTLPKTALVNRNIFISLESSRSFHELSLTESAWPIRKNLKYIKIFYKAQQILFYYRIKKTLIFLFFIIVYGPHEIFVPPYRCLALDIENA